MRPFDRGGGPGKRVLACHGVLLNVLPSSSFPHPQFDKDLKGDGQLEIYDFDTSSGSLTLTASAAMPQPLWALAYDA